jgi:hypothetical protein
MIRALWFRDTTSCHLASGMNRYRISHIIAVHNCQLCFGRCCNHCTVYMGSYQDSHDPERRIDTGYHTSLLFITTAKAVFWQVLPSPYVSATGTPEILTR